MNYYPHHIGDHTRDTAHLSMLEDGAYRRLLDLYYTSEKSLPLDRAVLYRLLRAREKAEKEAIDIVLQEFFREEEDGWHQDRCDAEVAKMQEKGAKAKASAAIRWQSERNPPAMRTHNRTHNEGKANGTPNAMLPNNQDPITKTQNKTKANGSAFAAPLWIPEESWKAFEQMRAKSRKPMTDRARELIVKELETLRGKGFDPVLVLDQSIRNNWQDVFPLKDKGGSTQSLSAFMDERDKRAAS